MWVRVPPPAQKQRVSRVAASDPAAAGEAGRVSPPAQTKTHLPGLFYLGKKC